MRIFYYRCLKNITMVYVALLLVFSYRLTYNAFYPDMHEYVETNMFSGVEVYPSGEIVGIYTRSDGIFVIDTCEVETIDGAFVNPAGQFINTGDYVIAINGQTLQEKEDVVTMIQESQGDSLEFTIRRDEEIRTEELTPVLSKKGEYMLGIWVKDDLAGVGTITYVSNDSEFGALGHGMANGNSKEILEISGGDIYVANVFGIQKGKKGEPGEVKGSIKYGKSNHIATVEDNSKKGIYGKVDEDDLKRYKKEESYTIGSKESIKVGSAQIISEISGERKQYDIEITYIDYLAMSSQKELHIKVVDEELLELTGGIVQGMSGSPIIQDGKLVGAVTHVLVNDPTSGYGIFIEEMLKDKEE